MKAIFVAFVIAAIAPIVSSCGAAGGGLGTLIGGYLLYRQLQNSRDNNTTGLTSEIAVTNVAGGTLTLSIGQTYQLVVRRTYQIIVNGVTVPQTDEVTNSCSYASDAANISTVTTGGLVSAVQVGTANILVTYINGPLQNTTAIAVNVVTPGA